MRPLPYLHPVLSSTESQAFEKQLFQGNESLEWKAMNQAGASIAQQTCLDIQEIYGQESPSLILVLVGKGHNGGDAIIATRHLLGRFHHARAILVFPFGLGHLRPLVQRSLNDLQVSHGSKLEFLSIRSGNKEAIQSQLEGLLDGRRVDICFDGILGMQFRPPLRSPTRELIEVVNDLADIACRIAVDVPSGVGDQCDEVAFKADFTYATGIAKMGLFLPASRGVVGRIRYLDLGFFQDDHLPSRQYIVSGGVLAFRRELRDAQMHKKRLGHVFVVGGSSSMPGAVLMAINAALKSGVGLVTAFVPETIVAEAASRLPEAMWVGLPLIPEDGGLALEGIAKIRALATRATGWAIGPGLGRNPETATLIEEILALSDAPVLLDADALQPTLMNREWKDRHCVITPHVGEFNRLRERPLSECIADVALQAYANDKRCTVLLKGAPTLVAHEKLLAYGSFGGPVLSRGGSGDVLSGLIGGRISIPGTDFLGAILEGAAWHGGAADHLARAKGQTSVKVTDIMDFL